MFPSIEERQKIQRIKENKEKKTTNGSLHRSYRATRNQRNSGVPEGLTFPFAEHPVISL